MKKVTLKDKTFRISIPYEDISKAIDQVAEKINADFRGCEDVPVLLCVLNGSIMFMGELMKRLDFNCQIVSTKLSSYEGTESTGKVKQALGLTADIKGTYIVDINGTECELTVNNNGDTVSKSVLLAPNIYFANITKYSSDS